MATLNDVLVEAANKAGIDPNLLRRLVQIESGGNPNAQTGSYTGLGQFSPAEWAQWGNGGDIRNPVDNANAFARKLASEMRRMHDYSAQTGRTPTATELYLQHQQGAGPGGGADRHYSNPDELAWKNMYATGEGQEKGPAWAKAAIWGNIPTNPKTSPTFNKAMFPGGVDTVTSSDFIKGWQSKVEGGSAPTYSQTVAQGDSSRPIPFAQRVAPFLNQFTPRQSAPQQRNTDVFGLLSLLGSLFSSGAASSAMPAAATAAAPAASTAATATPAATGGGGILSSILGGGSNSGMGMGLAMGGGQQPQQQQMRAPDPLAQQQPRPQANIDALRIMLQNKPQLGNTGRLM